MYTIYKLTVASLKMFVRNRQALFFSLFMPLMILFIFGYIRFDAAPNFKIGVVTHKPTEATAEFVDQLRAMKIFTLQEGTLETELAALKKGDLVLVLNVPDDLITKEQRAERPALGVYQNQARLIEASTAMSMISQIADKKALGMAKIQPAFDMTQESLDSRQPRYIEFLLPGVIAMSVMQMSVFSVAFVFAQYREKGVLKRVLATPVKPYQFVTANIITRLIMSVTQAMLFTLLGVAWFKISISGPFWLLLVCIVLGALMFLGLGFSISGLSKTTETVPVLANIVVFPQLFLGNVFFSAANMPGWLKPISDNLPLSFFARAVRAVMNEGAGVSGIQNNLLGMLVWAVVLITIATVTFRIQERESA